MHRRAGGGSLAGGVGQAVEDPLGGRVADAVDQLYRVGAFVALEILLLLAALLWQRKAAKAVAR